MKHCTLCGQELSLAKNCTSFAEVTLLFKGFTIDRNTSLEEEVQSLQRDVKSYMCPTCFADYTATINNLRKKTKIEMTDIDGLARGDTDV